MDVLRRHPRRSPRAFPGAELTEDLGDDKYRGKVAIRMGPVKLQFAGNVAITERDNAGKRIVVDAAGADEKGRGQAAMLVTAKLLSIAGGTKIDVEQDLQLSGAAAQYGRGMISDVTSVLMRDFADNMQKRITARDRASQLGFIRPRRPAGSPSACAPRGWPCVVWRVVSSCPISPIRVEENSSWFCGGSAT